MNLFYVKYFNTSHVLIYLVKRDGLEALERFQYISCSYLSFIFISFYFNNSYFNTSHVLIYRLRCRNRIHPQKHFNTSHVLIYLSFLSPFILIIRISIHLMFLFIAYAAEIEYIRKNISIHLMFLFISLFSLSFLTSARFQYISCSYLS